MMTFMGCSPASVHVNIRTSKYDLTKQFTMSQFKLQLWICQFRGLHFTPKAVCDRKVLQTCHILTANSNGNFSAAQWHLKLWSHSSSELGCIHMCCGSMNRRMCLEASFVVRGEGESSPSYPQIPVDYPGNAAKSQTTTATNSLFDSKAFIFSTSFSLVQISFFKYFYPQADLS